MAEGQGFEDRVGSSWWMCRSEGWRLRMVRLEGEGVGGSWYCGERGWRSVV